DGRFVYVANTGSNDVSVIETASGSVVKTIPAGKAAHGVVISPDGRFVYVSNTEAGTVTVIEVARQAVVATVPAAYGANGI
ncbi:UNVERIFIED_CONTAM: beta-propeller fold lactonase family protein, partial [Salmonella enterica subsp. enterica serovar Weltevreden]